jgi:hypothetical protein
MIDMHSGVEAAHRFLAGREVQEGLMRLWEETFAQFTGSAKR